LGHRPNRPSGGGEVVQKPIAAVLIALVLTGQCGAAAAASQRRNAVIFIASGLGAGVVAGNSAPTFAMIRDTGVNFANSHAVFPTSAIANAAALATGHAPGDTPAFANTVFTNFAVAENGGSATPSLESNAVLGEIDNHFTRKFLGQMTLLAAARKAGYSTAAVGRIGAAAIQDLSERTGQTTIVIDDATGNKDGIPLAPQIAAALRQAGLPLEAPKNWAPAVSQVAGSDAISGQEYFLAATTRAILPGFARAAKPFMLVFWYRDPEGAPPDPGDSPRPISPGVNADPSGLKGADRALASILTVLRTLGLYDNTDIVVAGDHGLSTVAKESKTSPAARFYYGGEPIGILPPGFLAIDLAQALGMPLRDPDLGMAEVKPGQYPKRGNGLIGFNPEAPDVVVSANGGSDLIYLPQKNARDIAPDIVTALLDQDYVSGLFVDGRVGAFPGTLALGAINFVGYAPFQRPAIVVAFRSFDTLCGKPELCAAEIGDGLERQGHGGHGGFSRADTANFMAAAGPDFKPGFVDTAPAAISDIPVTLAHVLGLELPRAGGLMGRVLSECLKDGAPVSAKSADLVSKKSPAGLATVVNTQQVGNTVYLDAGGFVGRTVGLKPATQAR
jgi:hypothetical protein